MWDIKPGSEDAVRQAFKEYGRPDHTIRDEEGNEVGPAGAGGAPGAGGPPGPGGPSGGAPGRPGGPPGPRIEVDEQRATDFASLFRLDGKRVILVGGYGGIGEVTTRLFAEYGAELA